LQLAVLRSKPANLLTLLTTHRTGAIRTVPLGGGYPVAQRRLADPQLSSRGRDRLVLLQHIGHSLLPKLRGERPLRTGHKTCLLLPVRSDNNTGVGSHFARVGLNVRAEGSAPRVFGRFEAAGRNERWMGDALH